MSEKVKKIVLVGSRGENKSFSEFVIRAVSRLKEERDGEKFELLYAYDGEEAGKQASLGDVDTVLFTSNEETVDAQNIKKEHPEINVIVLNHDFPDDVVVLESRWFVRDKVIETVLLD